MKVNVVFRVEIEIPIAEKAFLEEDKAKAYIQEKYKTDEYSDWFTEEVEVEE